MDALFDDLFSRGSISCSDNDRASVSGEEFGSLGSDSWVAACDDSILSFEIKAGDVAYSTIEELFE